MPGSSSNIGTPEDRASLIQAWSELYGRQITEEEYREICDNLKGFFDILLKWDRAEQDKK